MPNIDPVWFGWVFMLKLRALEWTILTIPHTCMWDTYKAIYKLSKLKYPDERTDERTDICASWAAFAAENPLNPYPLCLISFAYMVLMIFYNVLYLLEFQNTAFFFFVSYYVTFYLMETGFWTCNIRSIVKFLFKGFQNRSNWEFW